MSYTVAPYTKKPSELVVYDWIVIDEVAYRVTAIEKVHAKGDPDKLTQVTLGGRHPDESYKYYKATDIITVLLPK